MEFLRRVVIELSGRTFQYVDDETSRPLSSETIHAVSYADVLLHVLPEITRGFACKIRPEFTRCHKMPAPCYSELEVYFARDPISGVSIRCFRNWDVIQSRVAILFDAAFS